MNNDALNRQVRKLYPRHFLRGIAGLLVLTWVCLAAPVMASNNRPLINPAFTPLLESAELGGRTLVWAELGDAGGRPLLFAVGFPHAAATGAGVLSVLNDFLDRQGVRLIAMERTGATNRSSFDPDDTLDNYVMDVVNLTAHLGIEHFSMMAFSAGGPGALAVAAQLPQRVRSLHLMAARGRYEDALAERTGEQDVFNALSNDPFALAPFFQSFPPPRFFLDPGTVSFLDTFFGPEFVDEFIAEGIESLDQNPEGLSLSRAIGYQPWSFELADVIAPVFVYQGWADPVILPEGFSQDTPARVGGLATVRFYPGESHFETHLRHLDQVVLDMRHQGRVISMCGTQGQRLTTRYVRVRQVRERLQDGFVYGDCFWRQ